MKAERIEEEQPRAPRTDPQLRAVGQQRACVAQRVALGGAVMPKIILTKVTDARPARRQPVAVGAIAHNVVHRPLPEPICGAVAHELPPGVAAQPAAESADPDVAPAVFQQAGHVIAPQAAALVYRKPAPRARQVYVGPRPLGAYPHAVVARA